MRLKTFLYTTRHKSFLSLLMLNLILLATFLLLSTGCKTNDSLSKTDVDAIHSELRSIMAEQQDSWNHGDIEGFMAYYWKNDSLKFITSRNVRVGWNNVLEGYKKGFPKRDDMGKLTFRIAHINVVKPDIATVSGKWEVSRTSDVLSGGFTLLFRKFDDGTWKIVQDFTY